MSESQYLHSGSHEYLHTGTKQVNRVSLSHGELSERESVSAGPAQAQSMGQTDFMCWALQLNLLLHIDIAYGIIFMPTSYKFSANSTLPPVRLGEPDVLRGVRPFVDSLGRERYFHGVNAVVKGPPWHPSTDGFDPFTSLSDDDFKIMQRMGFTVIRLGFMWAGFEPNRGDYNMSYLNIMKSIASNAAKFGIYTLIDMHQDVFSDKFCGEGVPSWAVKSSGSLRFPEPVDGAYPTGADR